jgi:hypothetical protein
MVINVERSASFDKVVCLQDVKKQDSGNADTFSGFRFVAVKFGKEISCNSGLDNKWGPLRRDNSPLPIIISEDTLTSHKGEWVSV